MEDRGKAAARRLDLAAGLAIAISAVLAYWQVGRNGFLSLDDDVYVTENAVVSRGLTREGVRWALTAFHAGHWHPLTWISHMLDVSAFGMDAGPHHVVNLLFHAANAVLLYVVLGRMTGNRRRSAFVAALFALHPLHVESVAWVAERKDLLCAFFFLSALLCYRRYVERPGGMRYLAVAVLSVLALLSKPMAVTLPFVLLLLDYWPLGRQGAGIRRLVGEKIPLFCLSAASCAVAYAAGRDALKGLDFVSMGDRLANAVSGYGKYLWKMLWPHPLAVLYPLPKSFPTFETAAGAAILLACSAAAVRWRRRAPYALAGWLWYLGTLVPVIGLVYVGAHSIADRYTYIPLIGPFVAIAWGCADLAARSPHVRRALPFAGAAVLALLFSVTRVQTRLWSDSMTLYRHTLSVTAGNWVILNNLGVELAGQGRYDEAIASYREALRHRPDYPDAHYNLASDLEQTGKIDEAIGHYEEVLRLCPGEPDARKRLAALRRAPAPR